MIIFLKEILLLFPGIVLSFVVGRLLVNYRDREAGGVPYAFGPRFWVTTLAVALVVPLAMQILFALFTFFRFSDDWCRSLSLAAAGALYGYAHGQRPGMAPFSSIIAGILGGVACWSLYATLERAHLTHLAIPMIFCVPPLLAFEFFSLEQRLIHWTRVIVPQGGFLH